MRNKSSRVNQRKSVKSGHARELGEESAWIMLEADLSGDRVAPRRRPGARRRAWTAFFAIACLCITIPAGGIWAYRSIFYQNEEFILEHLTIRSDGTLGEAQLAEIANVSPGMNLMKLDLPAIRAQILKLPHVEDAVVTRELPDRLNITVRERIPVAWLSCPPLGIRPGDMERGRLVDDKGYCFRCLDLTDAVKSLPIIEVYKMAEPVEGHPVETDGFAAALELIQKGQLALADRGLVLDQVILRNEWSLLGLYRNGLQVTFGMGEIERGLQNLGEVLTRTQKLGSQLLTVNVAARRNIPVTFAEPLPANPAGAGTAEPKNAQPEENDFAIPEAEEGNHLQSILQGG